MQTEICEEVDKVTDDSQYPGAEDKSGLLIFSHAMYPGSGMSWPSCIFIHACMISSSGVTTWFPSADLSELDSECFVSSLCM